MGVLIYNLTHDIWFYDGIALSCYPFSFVHTVDLTGLESNELDNCTVTLFHAKHKDLTLKFDRCIVGTHHGV